MAGVERSERGNPQETPSERHNKQKYIYELPYLNRKQLCRILDINSDWKELAGTHMGFSVFDILVRIKPFFQEIENECKNCGSSPTDVLLSRWGQQNHTTLELFVLLARMQHNTAMTSFKQLVDPRYHCLIDQQPISSNSNQRSTTDSRMISSDNNNVTSNEVPLYVQYHQQGIKNESSEKLQNGPPYQTSTSSNSTRPSNKSVSPLVAESAGALLKIPYSELATATENFKTENVLGSGGFGIVYKGIWKHTAVAIKKLKKSNTGESTGVSSESLRELKYLNACRHDNVLPLYGYSIDGNDFCLVYQLMSGGSLEDRLRCKNKQPPLLWDQRLRIAQGVAKGLQFLHTVSRTPLIHGDIKSGNILLDTCGEPRIGDFGLAREGPGNEELTHMKVSRVHGTMAYIPDEFLKDKKLSVYVDTYSFGIVLFELITGLPAQDNRREHRFLKDYVLNYCDKNGINIAGLQDKRLLDSDNGNLRLCHDLFVIGVKCVQYEASNRPHMVEVWQNLMKIKY